MKNTLPSTLLRILSTVVAFILIAIPGKADERHETPTKLVPQTSNPGKVPRPAMGTVGKPSAHSIPSETLPSRFSVTSGSQTLTASRAVNAQPVRQRPLLASERIDVASGVSTPSMDRHSPGRVNASHTSSLQRPMKSRDSAHTLRSRDADGRMHAIDGDNVVQASGLKTQTDGLTASALVSVMQTNRSPLQPNPHRVKTLTVPEITLGSCQSSASVDSTCDDSVREPDSFSYYYRPYQFTDVVGQQTRLPNVQATNPYDNRFFESIYRDLATSKTAALATR